MRERILETSAVLARLRSELEPDLRRAFQRKRLLFELKIGGSFRYGQKVRDKITGEEVEIVGGGLETVQVPISRGE